MYAASVAIEGMVCGSCVGAINRNLQELNSVINISVDNNGSIEFRGKEHLDKTLESRSHTSLIPLKVLLCEMKSRRSDPSTRLPPWRYITLRRSRNGRGDYNTMRGVPSCNAWSLAALFAIPTFIIGIVCMALVPEHNPTRMWFEEPTWAGNASRTEWVDLRRESPTHTGVARFCG
ncbi:uncharacterized protein PV07_05961 [Cladophialophora immunda]|uniref:HMA domain-containing protein n=1 Tax=Cladophialophora immunda TaxID=569365 RepID=A0A0D2AY20_9EURO|nr:uncharacterized protein PV07_05961 [Cladophialophora immunda]KIW30202.1 hypothetical protein PV07_05961 [Cladophialophora immunda]